MGVSRSVPEVGEGEDVGVAKGVVVISLAPLAARGCHMLESSALLTQSARETTSARSDRTGGSDASRVLMDLELSQRIAICGFWVGCVVVVHSSCQSSATTIEAARKRSTSRTAWRMVRGPRCHEITDNALMRIRAMMPIQSVTGVGLS